MTMTTTVQPAIGVTNLRLKYPGDSPLVFKGLSLSIQPGEKVLLLGPSGCGKSTLLQVMCGIVPATVELPMKADQLVVPERWGYVFQDPDSQFCMPYVDEELAFVLENLMVPREDMPALIGNNLERVGLQLEDPHTPIHHLSQGMKQRLAIASVLALEPDVLFLDEPTALLDPEGTKQVWSTLRDTAGDRTLLIVEHKIEGILDWVSRVIVFTPEGDILADGAPQAVFEQHRQALTEFGIWYPGVWDAFPQPTRDINLTGQSPSHVQDQVEPQAPLLTMTQFQGLRGGLVKINVKEEKVQPGDWISIVGENGAGKSSLLLAIMRLLRTNGECKVNGAAVNKPEALAQQIGFVFQNPEFQFIADTVEEELLYGLDASPALQDELLAAYELDELRSRHPYQLSMGQKRRLSVATALVRGQRLLLLDEPTFGLDARNTVRVLEHLEQQRREGTAILMVTHDPEIVRRYSTRIWTIAQGQLISEGIGVNVWS